ncbi:hypothetical protein C8R43DRAFT_1140699 [Mycena crocata]|nr:hypothetical protein C8R43DRAFT_1140699 [Mycena crocata]
MLTPSHFSIYRRQSSPCAYDLHLIDFAARSRYFTQPPASRRASVRWTVLRSATIYSACYGVLSVATAGFIYVTLTSSHFSFYRRQSSPCAYDVHMVDFAATRSACFGALGSVAVSYGLFGMLRYAEQSGGTAGFTCVVLTSSHFSLYRHKSSPCAYDLHIVDDTATRSACVGAPGSVVVSHGLFGMLWYAEQSGGTVGFTCVVLASSHFSLYRHQSSPCAYDLHIVDDTATRSACVGAPGSVVVSHGLSGMLRCGEQGCDSGICVTLTSSHFSLYRHQSSPCAYDLHIVDDTATRSACVGLRFWHLRNVDIVSFLGPSSPCAYDLHIVDDTATRLACVGAPGSVVVSHGLFGMLWYAEQSGGTAGFTCVVLTSSHFSLYRHQSSPCAYDLHIVDDTATRSACVGAPGSVVVSHGLFGMLCVGIVSFFALLRPIIALRLRSTHCRLRRDPIGVLRRCAEQSCHFAAHICATLTSSRLSLYRRQSSPCAYDLHIVDYVATRSACFGALGSVAVSYGLFSMLRLAGFIGFIAGNGSDNSGTSKTETCVCKVLRKCPDMISVFLGKGVLTALGAPPSPGFPLRPLICAGTAQPPILTGLTPYPDVVLPLGVVHPSIASKPTVRSADHE